MKNYKVTFFKLEKDEENNVTDTKFLGMVTLDDNGTSNQHTLTAKAFRIADNVCCLANKVLIEELK